MLHDSLNSARGVGERTSIEKARVETFGSAILIAMLVVLVAVIVHREFLLSMPRGQSDPPRYVAEWRSHMSATSTSGAMWNVRPRDDRVVHIVEFIDLQCPACRAYHSILENVRKRFGDRIIVTYIHYPLPYHEHAYAAARAAECSRGFDKFEQFVAAVYEKQDSLGAKSWEAYATSVGITAGFSHCASDSARVAAVDSGMALGALVGVASTPALMVEGWLFPSPPSEPALVDAIRRILKGRTPTGASYTQRAGAVMPRKRSRDGVQFLEHDVSALGRAPQLVVERTAQISFGRPALDPAYDLTDVKNAVLLSDGRLVTFAPYGAKLFVLDRTGPNARRISRQGSGPGEFSGVSSMAAVSGDTLLLPDFGTMRLNWVLPDKGVVKTVSLADRVSRRTRDVVGSLSGGRVVFFTSGVLRDGMRGRIARQSAPVVVLAPDRAGQEIASLPDIETAVLDTRYEGRRGEETVPIRFTRRAAAIVWDSLIVTSSGDGYRIDQRTDNGRLLAAIVVNARRRALTNRMKALDIDTRLKEMAAWRERPRDPAESARLIREAPYADSLPPYAAMFVTPQNTLWVVDAIAPGDTTWNATGFRLDGAIVGRVRATVRGYPVAMHDDRVVLRITGADGIVQFNVHRIVVAQ